MTETEKRIYQKEDAKRTPKQRMKKAYIISQNSHLNYIQVEVIEERKTLYVTLNHGKVKKDDLYFTERDVINALIARIRKEKTRMNELKINIPEGYEIDKENSTFELIKFKPIKKELPKRWEDLEVIKGYWISNECNIETSDMKPVVFNRNVFPSKEYAEASLALAQLLQLRQVYNEGWEPDYTNGDLKYVIYVDESELISTYFVTRQVVMSFKTAEIRDLFFENFKDLLEIAKPLL